MCKKTHFKVLNTSLNRACLDLLLDDGYISAYKFIDNFYIKVISPPFDLSDNYNRIVVYSSMKWPFYIKKKKLKTTYGDGGYYILSTPEGIMTDSLAWEKGLGGILLFAIF